MADIIDDCRAAARTLEGWGRVTGPSDWIGNPSVIAGHLTKSAIEVEKLRKEVKLLRSANRSLAARNIFLTLLLGFVVCGGFMAMFLVR